MKHLHLYLSALVLCLLPLGAKAQSLPSCQMSMDEGNMIIGMGSVGVGNTEQCQITLTPAEFNMTGYSQLEWEYFGAADGVSVTSTCTANSYYVSPTTDPCYDSIPLVITYTPTTYGSINYNNVALSSWGIPQGGTVSGSILITGTGAASKYLSVTPTVLPCGPSSVGSAFSCGTVTVSASGGSVTLSSPIDVIGSSSGTLSVSSETCAAGMTLSSGQSCTITLSFNASAAGDWSGTFGVYSTDGEDGNVTLSGDANSAGGGGTATCTPNSSEGQYCVLAPL